MDNFTYTTNLDAVVNNMLLPYTDYFTKVFSMDKENVIVKIKGIIAREVNNISDRDIIRDVFPETEAYAINIQDLVNWQEEIFQSLPILNSTYMIGYRRDNRVTGSNPVLITIFNN